MKKCTSSILIFSLCMMLLTGCGGNKRVEQEYLLSGEYFKDQSIIEHTDYLAEMFYTLAPEGLKYADYGLTTLRNIYGADIGTNTAGVQGEESMYKYDQVITGATNMYFYSKIPVFYGLLKETAVFEEKMGIDTSKLAKKHGTKYAVRAEDVEDFCTMIFRRTDVQVQHQSTSGAEYIEEDNVYVYDELINPLQKFYDNGWELDFVPSSYIGDEQDDAWGGDLFIVSADYLPIWYGPDGTVYDMYGDIYFKQEDPQNRFKDSNQMVEYMLKINVFTPPAYVPWGQIAISIEPVVKEGTVGNDVSSTINSIEVGMSQLTYGTFEEQAK